MKCLMAACKSPLYPINAHLYTSPNNYHYWLTTCTLGPVAYSLYVRSQSEP